MPQELEIGTVEPTRVRLPQVLPFVALAFALLLIAYYGTAIYNYFIPTVIQKRDFSLGIWILAVVAGVAGFLSPCAFGMLPAYFAFFLSVDRPGPPGPGTLRRAVRYGLGAALGMITVAVVLAILILILGATFAPGLRVVTPVPNPYTRAFRILAGVLLVVLGILQWRGRSIGALISAPVRRLSERAHNFTGRDQPPFFLFYQYGILYVLVSLPCVANVMAAPLLAALATQGLSGVIAAEFLFLLTMGGLMMVVSVFIGLADETVLAGLRTSIPTLLRAASVVLVLIGLALVYLDLDLATFRRLFFHFPIR